MYKFGFIGIGNMGGAIATAVANKIGGDKIIVSDKSEEKVNNAVNILGCSKGTAEDVARTAEYIVLGVKPQGMKDTADSIKNILGSREDTFVIISMAAGIEIKVYEEFFGETQKVIRIMPNLPAKLGMGATVYCANKNVTENEITEFVNSMEKTGLIIPLEENLINAASAISGSGPAFVYMFAESIANAGVKCGLSKDIALKLATQTLIGAGNMLEREGKSPETLRIEVCSPGGTTIEGVNTLESNGFRKNVMDAIDATYQKNFKLMK